MAIAEQDAAGRTGAAGASGADGRAGPDGRGRRLGRLRRDWVLLALAAPFGTKEYELNHSGVEGTHFTRDQPGSPIPTEPGLDENPVQLPVKYLCDAPRVLHLPGRPDVVKRNHAWQLKVAPMLVRNPTWGLRSANNSRVGASIDTLRTDTVGSIIAGRKPLSAWDGTVKKTKSMGLDLIAVEYAKDYASNH